mgnify:CR=1 FL=1|jgi:hypothetical protein
MKLDRKTLKELEKYIKWFFKDIAYYDYVLDFLKEIKANAQCLNTMVYKVQIDGSIKEELPP